MLSRISQILVDLLSKRDAAGKKKYGVTLDRADLTHTQWLDHATEELLDAAGYLQAAKRDHAVLEKQAAAFRFLCLKFDHRCKTSTCERILEDFDLTGTATQEFATIVYHAMGAEQ